jgi:hypothetical protein
VVQPIAIDFGSVIAGSAATKSISLGNSGNEIVRIESTTVSASLLGELRVDGVPAGLVPGASHTVDLVLAPSGLGGRDGEIVFHTDSSATPAVAVRVVAQVSTDRLTVVPSSLDFGPVRVGQTATSAVILSNVGGAPVVISVVGPDPSTPSVFGTELPGSSTLIQGDSLMLEVHFSPLVPGFTSGTIIAEDESKLVRASFSVTGYGIGGDLEVDPGQLLFFGVPVGQMRSESFVVRNVGGSTVGVAAVSLTASSSGAHFSIEPSSAGPFVLAPAEEHVVVVSAAPTSLGMMTGVVQVQAVGDEVWPEISLALDVHGPPGPSLSIEPTSVEFGTAWPGAPSMRSLWIENLGTTDLSISSLRIEPASSAFRLADPGAPLPLGSMLAPLDARRVDLIADASAPDEHATLVIASDDPLAPTTAVPLHATGDLVGRPAGNLDFAPPSLSFAHSPSNMIVERSLTLRNVGGGMLTIDAVSIASGQDVFQTFGGPALPAGLAPGEELRVPIGFSSANTAQFSGSVQIDTDSGNALVPLEGDAVPMPANEAFHVQLSWSETENLDLHVLRPGGILFDVPSDACFCNPSPDWGARSFPDDDPLLLADQLTGGGTEDLQLPSPTPGDYSIWVVHAGLPGQAGTAQAGLTVFANQQVAARLVRTLPPGGRWRVGTASWVDPLTMTFLPSDLPVTVPGPEEPTSCY